MEIEGQENKLDCTKVENIILTKFDMGDKVQNISIKKGDKG